MRVKAKFREYENGSTKGYVDFFVNGTVAIKGARLVEGKNGPFVSMPAIKGNNKYKDVITGISAEFSAKLLEAALAARDSDEKEARVGEEKDGYYDVHVGVIPEPKGATKALVSLTVKPSEFADKSYFTIQGIRVNQRKDGLAVIMPSKKTGNEEYPYENVCVFLGDSKDFLDKLILSDVKNKLGIESKKKPSLDSRVKDAEEKSMQQQDPASVSMTMGKEPAMAK